MLRLLSSARVVVRVLGISMPTVNEAPSLSSSSNTVAQKIRKLLALADGNKNENERNSAMKLAMELLSKHNLDMAQVADSAEDVDVVEVDAYLKLDPWIRSIMHAACTLYYTRFIMRPIYGGYYGDRKEWHPTFVGTPENIDCTMEIATWLIDSIRQESNWLFRAACERRSFRVGAADRILERANQLIAEEKQNCGSTPSNSLMVLRNQLESANQKYMDKKNLGTFQSRGSYHDRSAYGLGQSFGNNVNLGKTVKPKALPYHSPSS